MQSLNKGLISLKNRLIRFFSLVTAIIITITAFPLSASATTFNRIVNASTDIIMTNEGTYTTVVRNDNGSLSIGKICWHGTNALNLLKDIVAKNPTQALSILGKSLYNEIITYSSWDTKIPTVNETAVITVLLSTAESREVQDKTAWEYISKYVDHGISLGITEPEALIFFADYENQMGRNGAASFYYNVMRNYGEVNLGTLFSASSKNARRVRTYNFCATINWNNYSDNPVNEKDTVPPEISDVVVSNINTQGYTVSCTASDNKKVMAIFFAVFHQDDGSENAKWYRQDTTATAKMTIDITEFNNRAGNYCTYIYVFDEAGNYSYVELNAVKVPEVTPAEPKLSLTVSATSAEKVGEKMRWRASASGGSGSYLYTFSLYRDNKEIKRTSRSDYSDFEYTIDATGVYKVLANVYDTVSGKTATVVSSETNIFTPIVIESFNANIPAALLGQQIFWEVEANGGEGELEYSYTLYKDDIIVQSTDFKAGNYKYTYKPSEEGVYNVTVNIRDSRSQVISLKSDDITVIRPLEAENVSFSSDYAVAGKSVSCSVDIFGGTGSYTCVFSIYCDGVLVIESESLNSDEFTFTVPKAGKYTAKVTVTDADTTVTEAEGGSLSVAEKAQKGDSNCDGKLTAADARYALRCSAGLDTVDELFKYAVDVNEDGKITAADARQILRVVAQLDTF